MTVGQSSLISLAHHCYTTDIQEAAVQFCSVSRCALNRRRPASIRRREWRSSQVLHSRGTLSSIGQSTQCLSFDEIRRRAATTDDGRRRFLTVKNLRRPSPVVAVRRRFSAQRTSSSAVAKRPRVASCLSVVSFNSTKRQVESFIVSYVDYRFITVCS